MPEITTFEWKGGLKNIPVSAFEPGENEPKLLIKTLLVSVENNRRGFMHVEFALEDQTSLHNNRKGAWEFVSNTVKKLGSTTGSSTGGAYNLSFNPTPGEPLTETMMKKYLLLLKLCEVYAIIPPRIVTESFVQRLACSDSVPYGTHLMKKCLQEQLATS